MNSTRIGFYGLGLIGGSIARSIKERHPEIEMVATSGHLETVREAFRAGIISNDTLLSPETLGQCDLVFLCAPVSRNLDYLKKLQPYLKKDALLTDVGSVKGSMHEAAKALGLTDRFIGGHPMTGSEKTGFGNADAVLLENAYYLLVPESDVPEEKVQRFVFFITTLGALPLVLAPKEHDRITAAVSHLPHVIASTLVNLLARIDGDDEIGKRIAAGGFRDITRIASSSPAMWESICMENRQEILNLIGELEAELQEIKGQIAASDAAGIRAFFSSAKNYRDSLNVNTNKNVTVHELYSELSDCEGQIAKVTSLLADCHINLKNIGIIHNREFEHGVLQIAFYDDESVALAHRCLTKAGYTIYRR